MSRLRFLVSYLALLYFFALLAHAQAHGNSIQDHPAGGAVSNAGVPVLSNSSAVALNGPWKFRTGDSPKVPGSQVPLWAQTDFDDSGWQDYTIDPKHSAVTAAEVIRRVHYRVGRVMDIPVTPAMHGIASVSSRRRMPRRC